MAIFDPLFHLPLTLNSSVLLHCLTLVIVSLRRAVKVIITGNYFVTLVAYFVLYKFSRLVMVVKDLVAHVARVGEPRQKVEDQGASSEHTSQHKHYDALRDEVVPVKRDQGDKENAVEHQVHQFWQDVYSNKKV